MFYKDFEAWINVNGKDLDESDSWLNKDPFGLKDGKNKILNCKIPSEEGKEFTIHVRVFDKSLNNDYEVEFYVDGVLADDDLLRRAEDEGQGRKNDAFSQVISEGVQTSETHLKHYVFRRSAALSGTPTYNSRSGSDLELEPDFGLIRIEIRRVEVKGICTDNVPWYPPNFLRLAESPLEKRTTDTFLHRVGLSDKTEKLQRSPERLNVRHLQGEDSSEMIFEFAYSPANWLKTNGTVLKARKSKMSTSSRPVKDIKSADFANKNQKIGMKGDSISRVSTNGPVQGTGQPECMPASQLPEISHNIPGLKGKQSTTKAATSGSAVLPPASIHCEQGIQTPISRIRGQESMRSNTEQVNNVSVTPARPIKLGFLSAFSARRQTSPNNLKPAPPPTVAPTPIQANLAPTPVAPVDPTSRTNSRANSITPVMASFPGRTTGRTPMNIHHRSHSMVRRLLSGAAEHRGTSTSTPSETVAACGSAHLLDAHIHIQNGAEMIPVASTRGQELMADEMQAHVTSTHSLEDPELAQELPVPAPPDMYINEPDPAPDPAPDPEPGSSAEYITRMYLPDFLPAQVISTRPEARPVACPPVVHRRTHRDTERERNPNSSVVRAHEPVLGEGQETSRISTLRPERTPEVSAYTTSNPDARHTGIITSPVQAEVQARPALLMTNPVASDPAEVGIVNSVSDGNLHTARTSPLPSMSSLQKGKTFAKETDEEDDVLLPISDMEQLLRHRLQYFLNIEGIIQRAKCDIAADIESTDKMIAGMSFYTDEGGALQKRQSDLLEDLRSLEPRAGPSKKMRRN